MIFKETKLKGCFVLEPNMFEDDRGYFFESYNSDKFKTLGIDKSFIQDNQSLSQKGVLRGLHYQLPPYTQSKLVRAIQGEVLDVAVDIRKDSPTYGKHVSIELTEENKTMFYVPPGFAHGFLVR